jgi:arylsulfatase A
MSAPRPPNIILILIDDLGWAELGAYGNTFNLTPELDRLAKEGVRFTQAYATAPVCSPSRASLLTGQSPVRLGITDYLRPDSLQRLDPGVPTIASCLRTQGYHTGLIGKWHLGGLTAHGGRPAPPEEHGFAEVLLSEKRGIGPGSYRHPYAWDPSVQARTEDGEEWLIERMHREAESFVTRHRERPFFLLLSHYAVHTRLEGRPDLVAKHEARPDAGAGAQAPHHNPHLAAQLEQLDQGLGRLRATLESLGLDRDTLIAFTSDHGGEIGVTSNAPLRSGKSHLFEGGVRVPFIWHGPGRICGGRICDQVISHLDFLPTAAELAGLSPAPSTNPDARSWAKRLLCPAEEPPAPREVYWHYPLARPHFLKGRSCSAARIGDYKWLGFHQPEEDELYDLARDPGEENNLAPTQPGLLAALKASHSTWLANQRA